MKSKILVTLLLLINLSGNLLATIPTPPAGTTGNPTCWPPPCVPIDGGIIILAISGIAIVAYKFFGSRKKSFT